MQYKHLRIKRIPLYLKPSPGRNYKLLPTLAINMPLAYLLNASCFLSETKNLKETHSVANAPSRMTTANEAKDLAAIN